MFKSCQKDGSGQERLLDLQKSPISNKIQIIPTLALKFPLDKNKKI
jgi:hypothetical protein